MLRNFLLTGLILLLGSAILYVTLTRLDPLGEQSLVAYGAFFISIFAIVTAFFSFTIFFFLELRSGRRQGKSTFQVAIRRGALIGTLACALTVLQLFRFLGLLEAILLVTFFALVEWIFVMAGK